VSDAELGLRRSLAGPWYTDEAVFAAEQHALYGRRWVCVARADEAAQPGSFVTREVDGESLILVRQEDESMLAFFNVCRHRGSRILTAGTGRCEPAIIRCPYHAWTYGLDGALRAAPNMRDWRPGRGDDLGLRPVAVEERYGCLFVNLAEQPAAFDDDIRAQLLDRMGSDEHLAAWSLDTLVTGRRIVYDVAANWKLIVENFSECYHCPTVHPELTTVLPEFKQGRGTLHAAGYGAAYADSAGGFTFDGRPGLPPLPGLEPDDARRYYGIVITPNWFLNLVGDHVIMHRLEPLGPARTRVTCDWLFAPEVLEDGLDIGPSVELFSRVNSQDFAVCEQCQLGMSSRSFAHGGLLVPVEDQLVAFHDEVRAAVQETADGIA
jgi:glycine betaine catabolism A